MERLSLVHAVASRTVALMSDFGLGDGDVGIMKGVIAGIAPGAQIIDITHEVAPQDVASAAWILATAYRYFPASTVFICVVDPGVGSTRRAIALHAGEWFFVGPDNGLFSYVLTEQSAHGAVELSNPVYQLPQVSSTFHGRDIFAPAGAHLARGVPLAELGTRLDPAQLQRNDTEQLIDSAGRMRGHIVHVDRFGNLITSIALSSTPALLSGRGARLVFVSSGAAVERCQRFFAEGEADGSPFIYGDSSGYVAVAVRNGSAANVLRVARGAEITLELSDMS